MIRYESITISKDDIKNKTMFSLTLKKNTINVIYSSNKKKLDDLLLVSLGFLKPQIGSIIYDDIDLTKLNLSQKNWFFNNNIEYIFLSDFLFEKTTDEYLFEIANIIKKEDFNIKDFYFKNNISEFENKQFSQLSNKEKILFLIKSTRLKNTKFIFFYNIEILLAFENQRDIIDILKKEFADKIVVFLSTKKIFSNSETKINTYNLDELIRDETFFVRDNKNTFFPIREKIKQKNLFYFFKKITFKNNIELFSWYVLSFMFLSLLMLNFTNIESFVKNDIVIKNILIFFKSIILLINLLFAFTATYIRFLKQKNSFVFLLRKGMYIFDFIKLEVFYVLANTTILYLLFIPIYLSIDFTTTLNLNWMVFLSLYLICSIIYVFCTIFIYFIIEKWSKLMMT